MSNGTTQEKTAITLELRETERAHQQSLEATLGQLKQLRLQAEQTQELDVAYQQEQTLRR